MYGSRSASKDLQCGVPQGSVLEPLIYLLYTTHLVTSFELSISTPTTANFISLSLKKNLNETAAAFSRIEACARDIDTWVLCNKLKLNRDKTEILVLSARHRPRPHIRGIVITDAIITRSTSAWSNLRPIHELGTTSF